MRSVASYLSYLASAAGIEIASVVTNSFWPYVALPFTLAVFVWTSR